MTTLDAGCLFWLPRPVFRELRPIDVLNPAQKGDLAWTLRHNWRYRMRPERRVTIRERILDGAKKPTAQVPTSSAILIMPIATFAGTRAAIDSARTEPSEDALRARQSRKAPK